MSNPDPSNLCEWAASRMLDPEDETRFQAHLAECALCREHVAWDERLTRQLRAAPVSPVPSGIAARVRRRLWQRRLLRRRVAAAVVLLSIGLLWSRWPRPSVHPNRVAVENPPASVPIDVPGSNVLFAAPPVDSLDVLTQQQS